MPLQRIITDFGADVPFGQIPIKVQEHHGITLPVSSAQAITQQHAQQILQTQLNNLKTDIPEINGVECLIVEMDGSMIPIVTTKATEVKKEVVDRRTTRQTSWREARLAFARTPEQQYPVFGATLGTTDETGEQLVNSAIRVGVGQRTYVHGVGDGAPWIADQIAQRFGEPGRYLLDFYHLCDYLADASTVCANASPKAWLEQQKRRLKHSACSGSTQSAPSLSGSRHCAGQNSTRAFCLPLHPQPIATTRLQRRDCSRFTNRFR